MGRYRIATLALAPLLAFLCWHAAMSSETKPLYFGAAHLFSLDEVTIVYPGGDEADANRASAERRAAFLIHTHGIDAAVAADTEIGEEQLAGNLLLLGWKNRLLSTRKAPSPFQRSAGRMTFLGSIPVAEGEDLLFAFNSPYNPKRKLFFWSRIDPELDRLLVLPFLGSDWAVYRDFKVVAQGNFSEGEGWPPARNPGAEKRHEDLELTSPATAESEHFTLHYSEQALDAEQASAILKTRESALAAAVEKLGKPAKDLHIQLYVYENGEQKEAITGVPSMAHSITGRLESHMTAVQARSADHSEEIHLVAARLFGECHSTALYEGLAIAMKEPFEQSDLPAYAALLVQGNDLPSIDDLLDEEKLRMLLGKRLGLPASGLLVSWMISDGGMKAVEAAYSASPPSIDGDFKSWVEAVASGAEQELAFKQAVGEAQLRYERGDLKGAVEALEQALEVKPDDPETLYKLAMALIRDERESAAEKRFLRLAELQVAPEHNRYVIFAHYQLGKLYDDRGKGKKARAHYMEMLELPDEYDAHRKAREALGEAPQ